MFTLYMLVFRKHKSRNRFCPLRLHYRIFKTTYMLTKQSIILTMLSLEIGHLMTSSFGVICSQMSSPFCKHHSVLFPSCPDRFLTSWSSPHPISSSQLHVLPHFHPCPINLVVFKGVYSFRMGYLILRGASRLDAFSVYPFRAWLPGYRLGSLTGAPAARPSRSSRTKDSSSQISYAHAG